MQCFETNCKFVSRKDAKALRKGAGKPGMTVTEPAEVYHTNGKRMNLKDIGEFGFIEKITRGCLVRPRKVVKSIGDDTAAFRTDKDELTLLTTDLLVERVHFLRNTTSGFNLGYKSMAVNLSDIAAMGGTAREAFVSIAVPENCSVEFLEDLYRGMKHLAGEFEVNILGGDTTRSMSDLIINISVTGSVPENNILCRDAAQLGDIIFLTGFVGDSRAGLHLILNNIPADSEAYKALFNAHILPRPYLGEGKFLAQQEGVHAAIDISDGLSSDLGHIAKQSKIGVLLHADKIPVSQYLEKFCREFDFNPVEYALAGGEDYTLVITVSREKADVVAKSYFEEFGTPLYSIGEISDLGKMELIWPDGRIKWTGPLGWDHFRSGN